MKISFCKILIHLGEIVYLGGQYFALERVLFSAVFELITIIDIS